MMVSKGFVFEGGTYGTGDWLVVKPGTSLGPNYTRVRLLKVEPDGRLLVQAEGRMGLHTVAPADVVRAAHRIAQSERDSRP